MASFPGTIDLGKFRVVYEEVWQRPSDGTSVATKSWSSLNRDDYTVYCNDEDCKKTL